MALALLPQAAFAACSNYSDSGVDHFNDPLFGDDGLSPASLGVVTVLCWIITSLAVSAGIGGGGLLVPLYFIGLDVPQTLAVALSKGTIFGVACGNFAFLWSQRHPHVDRPLIDYKTAVFMQGGELMGVVLGVLFNLLLPQVVIIMLSALVLGFNAYKTIKKGIAKRAAETKAFAAAEKKAARPAGAGEGDAPPPTLRQAVALEAEGKEGGDGSTGDGASEAGGTSNVGSSANLVALDVQGNEALKKKILAAQARRFQPWAWALLGPMVTFFVVYSLLLGEIFDPDFTNCVVGYWPAYVSPFFFYGATTLYMARRNIAEGARMLEAGIEPVAGDIVWSRKSAGMLVPAAVGAGAAAGLLGIGGGMILGPIFVALDFQPQVGTATTGFMILFTAMGGTVKYLTIGKLSWQMFVWFAAVGAVGGQTGQRLVRRLIQRTGRPSYVVFLLGGIIAVAVVVMTSFGIQQAVEDADCGEDIWAPSTDQFVCEE